MKYWMHVDLTTARFAALIAAMVLYALAGSPSPDHPSWPEIFIGLFLVLAAGFPRLRNLFVFDKKRQLGELAGQILLIYGLSVSLIAAALHGNEAPLIFRDLTPFLFLFLPLLAGDIFEQKPQFFPTFLTAFAFMGLVFSLRALGETTYFNPDLNNDTRELYYFANAPSVLFAAVFPAGIALQKYLREFSLRSMAFLIPAAAFMFFPLLAMIMTLQRASIGWAVFALFCLAAAGFWRAPYRIMILFPAAFLIFFLLRENFFTVFELLSHKTAVYGVNKRGLEMVVVWQEVSGSVFSTFTGIGWGGTFESPAVGGARINFTHSFISAMLLKTGFAGLLLATGYISGFFINALHRDLVLTFALLGPLTIDVFLYASYKWLDFGLLLLLIVAARSCIPAAPIVFTKGNAQTLRPFY